MRLRSLSLRRPLSSYAKVQALVGSLVRNRRFQLRRPRIQAKHYLDVGCGPNIHPHFVNLDFLWHPGIDVCWDIRRGLPFTNGYFQGAFSEHCLEHFDFVTGLAILREIRRVLAPGASARIIVPDAELYLRVYIQQLAGDLTTSFPYQNEEARRPGWTPMQSVNRIFYQDRTSPFGHCTMYDFGLMRSALLAAGFTRVERRSFMDGRDPQLLVDTASRQCESLYVEASFD